MRRSIEFSVTPAGCFWMALALLILPLRWLLAWLIAAAVHELCHYCAVQACNGRIRSLTIDLGGAFMSVADLDERQECFCALAGPLGGLLLLMFARWIPVIAVCGLLQSLYNLLPLYPMDGGRALWCFARRFLSYDRAKVLCELVAGSTVMLGWLGAMVACFSLKLGLLPVLFAAILTLRTKFGKIPCKQRLKRVQ